MIHVLILLRDTDTGCQENAMIAVFKKLDSICGCIPATLLVMSVSFYGYLTSIKIIN